jgi:hypothetical protein
VIETGRVTFVVSPSSVSVTSLVWWIVVVSSSPSVQDRASWVRGAATYGRLNVPVGGRKLAACCLPRARPIAVMACRKAPVGPVGNKQVARDHLAHVDAVRCGLLHALARDSVASFGIALCRMAFDGGGCACGSLVVWRACNRRGSNPMAGGCSFASGDGSLGLQ